MSGENWQERIERQIAFIIEQQAQAEVRAAEADQRAAQADERSKRLDERWERTEDGIRSLLAIAEIHEREIGQIHEVLNSLGHAGRATDERLNALITVVERQISERRNEKSGSDS